MTKFVDKKIIVTGGATGIGAATVNKLLAEGAEVFILDLHAPKEVAANLMHVHCDVSSWESVSKAFQTIEKHTNGQIDGLFSNAGIYFEGSIEETAIENFRRVLDTNFSGTFYVVKKAIPMLKKNGGAIVLMGSDQAMIGKSASAIYGATKGAVGQLTKSLAIDYASANIRVNCICPGTIETPLYHKAVEKFAKMMDVPKEDLYQGLANAQPIKRVGQPHEVASVVSFLLSDEASYMTGALVAVDGGFVAQ